MSLAFLFASLAACLYAPWLVLLAVACGILLLSLSLLCQGGMWLLEQGAKALPSCWLFDGPIQASEGCKAKPPLLSTVADIDWDYRNDHTDYPPGRH